MTAPLLIGAPIFQMLHEWPQQQVVIVSRLASFPKDEFGSIDSSLRSGHIGLEAEYFGENPDSELKPTYAASHWAVPTTGSAAVIVKFIPIPIFV